MEIKYLSTKDAPQPNGHYSQATVFADLIFISGQLPFKPDGTKVNGSIEEQAEQTLLNIQAILKAAGSDWSKVLKMTIYVSDIKLWGQINDVYARILGDAKPARAVIPVNELNYGFKIEIDAVAVK